LKDEIEPPSEKLGGSVHFPEDWRALQFEELSYASPDDPPLKRWTIHLIEHLSGRPRLLPIYRKWQKIALKQPQRMMRELLRLIDVELEIVAGRWPPPLVAGVPLLIIANHPFGIGDGIALLSMAEQLDRPYRVFIDSQLMKVPEIRPYALPIDFSETREALQTNLQSRQRARELLLEGVTIVVFPAGGVATAPNPFGTARELPWKNFTARLVQQGRACVLPVYFEGQNSPLFHLVSRVSLTLRLSLIVSEFMRHFRGSIVHVHIGDIVPIEAFKNPKNGKALTRELYALVHRLAPRPRQAQPAATRRDV
jgi:putative hemolysin